MERLDEHDCEAHDLRGLQQDIDISSSDSCVLASQVAGTG